ncbi:MAG TPA: glycosyltransferase family 2 protein [Acidimicrobiales bacterium]|nr:glycosyltransferase family 2 protein [Acidimicrobiales bacterium]
MANVGVVVVTYRSAGTIRECLSSLHRASAAPIEIVVVDNASPDDSVAAARAAAPDAVVISQATNTGYGAANNAGVAALDEHTNYVLFANPDTVWPSGSIDELVRRLDDSIGLLSPTLVGEDGAPQPIVERDLSLGAAVRGMTRLGPPVRPQTGAGDVEWLHTAAALVPIGVVRALGGFDERFFLFAEDADLCRRVRALGRRVVITPDVTVTHVGGASMDASHDADALAGMRTRALATYLDKYDGALARRAFGAVGTLVYGLGRHRSQARAAWKALTR